MRPPIRACSWLCIVSSIALLWSVFSSPIRPPQTPNAHVYPNFLSRNYAPVSKESGLRLTTSRPGRDSQDADGSDFDEEDEDESFWSFSHLASPTSIPSISRPKPLSGPRPDTSPPRTAGVPLRC